MLNFIFELVLRKQRLRMIVKTNTSPYTKHQLSQFFSRAKCQSCNKNPDSIRCEPSIESKYRLSSFCHKEYDSIEFSEKELYEIVTKEPITFFKDPRPFINW